MPEIQTKKRHAHPVAGCESDYEDATEVEQVPIVTVPPPSPADKGNRRRRLAMLAASFVFFGLAILERIQH